MVPPSSSGGFQSPVLSGAPRHDNGVRGGMFRPGLRHIASQRVTTPRLPHDRPAGWGPGNRTALEILGEAAVAGGIDVRRGVAEPAAFEAQGGPGGADGTGGGVGAGGGGPVDGSALEGLGEAAVGIAAQFIRYRVAEDAALEALGPPSGTDRAGGRVGAGAGEI